jgi:hypothetical protein
LVFSSAAQAKQLLFSLLSALVIRLLSTSIFLQFRLLPKGSTHVLAGPTAALGSVLRDRVPPVRAGGSVFHDFVFQLR